jgi:hypothetical protein
MIPVFGVESQAQIVSLQHRNIFEATQCNAASAFKRARIIQPLKASSIRTYKYSRVSIFYIRLERMKADKDAAVRVNPSTKFHLKYISILFVDEIFLIIQPIKIISKLLIDKYIEN